VWGQLGAAQPAAVHGGSGFPTEQRVSRSRASAAVARCTNGRGAACGWQAVL